MRQKTEPYHLILNLRWLKSNAPTWDHHCLSQICSLVIASWHVAKDQNWKLRHQPWFPPTFFIQSPNPDAFASWRYILKIIFFSTPFQLEPQFKRVSSVLKLPANFSLFLQYWPLKSVLCTFFLTSLFPWAEADSIFWKYFSFCIFFSLSHCWKLWFLQCDQILKSYNYTWWLRR